MESFWQSYVVQIRRELKACSPDLALIFALSCAEKLYLGAEAVFRMSQTRFHLEIRKSIDRLWSNTPNPEPEFVEREYAQWLAFLDDESRSLQMAEEDCFGFGQQSGIAIMAGLDALRCDKALEAVEAGLAVCNVLDAYLIEKERIDINDLDIVLKMERHPLFIDEFARQLKGLRGLRKAARCNEELEFEKQALRKRAEIEGCLLAEKTRPFFS